MKYYFLYLPLLFLLSCQTQSHKLSLDSKLININNPPIWITSCSDIKDISYSLENIKMGTPLKTIKSLPDIFNVKYYDMKHMKPENKNIEKNYIVKFDMKSNRFFYFFHNDKYVTHIFAAYGYLKCGYFS